MYSSKKRFASADFDTKTFITVPNIITMVRLIILPFILILLNKGYDIWAVALIIFCGFTDVLDGFLAKVLNQATAIGKILDPVVDKIFYLAILVFLMSERGFPLFAFIIIVVLEVFILAGGYILISKYKIIPSSSIFGKFAVCLISLSVFLYIINIKFFKVNIIFELSLQQIILILSIIILFFATLIYGLAAKAEIKKLKIDD
ncbi:MAG: CDP-alcohol phosphatidyltransferase family protein [Candidatus Cloacimonadota bacterium]|nr:CDP-alcohol phosphatidyltransferase family protein [Candidatus Cloacimonadota bacterium]